MMPFDRYWFNSNCCALIGGGFMSNPGRYLNLLPLIKDQAQRGLAVPAAMEQCIRGVFSGSVCCGLLLRDEAAYIQTSVSVYLYQTSLRDGYYSASR
jgi:hypothetical protein